MVIGAQKLKIRQVTVRSVFILVVNIENLAVLIVTALGASFWDSGVGHGLSKCLRASSRIRKRIALARAVLCGLSQKNRSLKFFTATNTNLGCLLTGLPFPFTNVRAKADFVSGPFEMGWLFFRYLATPFTVEGNPRSWRRFTSSSFPIVFGGALT